MQASVELSMYPLGREYIPEIKAFVAGLKTIDDIEVEVNGMSTQIFGEYHRIMEILTGEMAKVLEQDDKCVFVMKVINGTMKRDK